MELVDWIVSIATIVVGIILTIVIMMQTTKTGSSVVSGENSNTFYGANKSKTLDGVLSKYTVVLSIIFIVLCICTTVVIIK